MTIQERARKNFLIMFRPENYEEINAVAEEIRDAVWKIGDEVSARYEDQDRASQIFYSALIANAVYVTREAVKGNEQIKKESAQELLRYAAEVLSVTELKEDGE